MDKDTYISQLEKQIEFLNSHITELNKHIESLETQLNLMTEAIKTLQKGKFGPSSEITKKSDYSQLGLFNEAEAFADESAPEPIAVEVRGHKRIKKTTRETLLKNLPVKEIICDITDDAKFCKHCGRELTLIGTEVVREEIEYIQPSVNIIRYVRKTYECQKCKHTDHRYIIKGGVPAALMNHSLASASSVANVMYQKYVNAVTLYRQEKDWKAMGIALSRATMANWIIKCSEDYLNPVLENMKANLLKRDIVHADETPIQVLKEEGKKPQTKSYMWLYRTSNKEPNPVILYEYQPSRYGDHAVEFLKDFKGYVHSDGYSGYNKLSNIIRVGCWAHLRRKFVEAIPSKTDKDNLSQAEIGRNYCDQLFHIEEKISDLTPDKIKSKREELSKPILDKFWKWVNTIDVLPSSALGKAMTYAKNQKEYLNNYLLDGRLELSNNAALCSSYFNPYLFCKVS